MKGNDTSVIVALFVSVLVAAFASLIHLGVAPWDAILYALQMIFLGYDKPDGSSPGLHFYVIRLALPALASWALIKAYMTLAGQTIDQWRAKRAFNHILICGSGEQAKTIAASHLTQRGARKNNIVLLTLEHSRADLEKLRREGVKILEGDASDAAVLSRVGIHRAAVVYIVAGADETNLRILEAVKEGRTFKVLRRQATCLVHVFDDYLCRQASASTKDWADTVQLDVVPFNSWKESARRALVQIGPDLFPAQPAPGSRQLHALVVGYSWFGQQLIEQLAHLGHYAGPEKLKVTLIAPCGSFVRSRLLTLFPALNKFHDPETWGDSAALLPIIDLEVIEAPMDGFGSNDLIQNLISSVSVAYVCADDAESGMAATNALLLQTPQLEFPIFVSSSHGLTPIQRFVESDSKRVRVFDALEEGLQLENNEDFLRHYTEREAALVHLYFTQKHDRVHLPSLLAQANITDMARALRRENSKDEHSNTVIDKTWLELERHWRELPEWSKESSRDTVRHLPIKQRATDIDGEILARMEHTRWVAERLLTGWRFAPESHREKRLHQDLVAFDQLNAQSKKKDSDIVEILRLLATAQSSFAQEIMMDLSLRADAAAYTKKVRFFKVQFAAAEQTIVTLEGPILCRVGDAIVTGTVGEQWPVPKDVFFSKYMAIPPTLNGESGDYQSLPQTVLAVQIQASINIELSAGRGRLAGSAGDWIVQYAPGNHSVVRDDIFRNTYA